MTDGNDVSEPIMALRRGGKAVVLMTFRGDW